MKSLLDGAAKVLFVSAGLSFWVGGGLLHAITGTDRVLSEMEGMALAAILAGLGFVAKEAGERLPEAENLSVSSQEKQNRITEL